MAGLRDRLAALGVPPRRLADNPTAESGELRQRLERLRGKGRGPVAAPEQRSLRDWVGGRWLDEGVVLVETPVPWTARQGERALGGLDDLDPLPGFEGSPPGRLLFFDTETTGLAGGTGTLVFLCGLAWLDPEGIRLRQYLLAGPAAEPRFLAALAGDFEADWTLVSYNGRGFDRPLLSTRFRLNAQPDPLAGRPHLDLLPWVRRAFRDRWPDCRLLSAERNLLGFHRTDDISGAEAPAAWLAYLRAGDGAALPAVLRHNRWDLLSLVALLPRLQAIYRRPEAFGAAVPAIARFLAARGERALALAILERNATALDPTGQRLLACLARQGGEGLRIWTRLAAQGSVAGIEALSKYHEHVRRDPQTAADFARRLPPNPRTQRRLERLARKGDPGA